LGEILRAFDIRRSFMDELELKSLLKRREEAVQCLEAMWTDRAASNSGTLAFREDVINAIRGLDDVGVFEMAVFMLKNGYLDKWLPEEDKPEKPRGEDTPFKGLHLVDKGTSQT
jgi:hypothetical protein